METVQEVEIPQVIPSELTILKDEVLGDMALRYGYVLGRSVIAKKKSADTKGDRDIVSATAKLIRQKLENYLNTGADVREDVRAFQSKRKDAVERIANASQPYNKRIKPLGAAIKDLDNQIPEKLKKVGFPVEPLIEVMK